jgi:hypothetical protein
MSLELRRESITVLPSRDEIRAHLVRLVRGQESAEDINDWASDQIGLYEEDHAAYHEEWGDVVWETLGVMHGADMQTSGGYLFGQRDYEAWLEEFDRLVISTVSPTPSTGRDQFPRGFAVPPPSSPEPRGLKLSSVLLGMRGVGSSAGQFQVVSASPMR